MLRKNKEAVTHQNLAELKHTLGCDEIRWLRTVGAAGVVHVLTRLCDRTVQIRQICREILRRHQSSQVTFIYIALLTMQIVLKHLTVSN